ncbi:cytosolic sulfotransferase 8-like [Apium graveolens]|uniref:cytosolic sulfotransferase 8-like n=1 Tax=Apium graveolens TaxID=4045 RepID=UPI003D791BD4
MNEGKVVYLCRDIKDTFISLFHFSNKANFRPSHISLEYAFDLFCRGVSLSGPIWDQILGYWKESRERPDKVLFMRYEEMTNEPHLQLRRLAHFLEKPFSHEEEKSGLLDQIIKLCSFDSMSKLEVNKTGTMVGEIRNDSFFRNGVVGDWKNYLTTEMASKLDQITEEKFRNSGLSLT